MGTSLNLDRLTSILSRVGCRKLYVKTLAENDNSKNQVYFGPNFESLNLIPNKGVDVDTKNSKSIFKAQVDFAWLEEDGSLYPAPKAKLILYPQYPEVRFSGFLQGCQKAPSEAMQPRSIGRSTIPDRTLFLGIRDDGRVIGYLAQASDVVAEQFNHIQGLNEVGVFKDASGLLSGVIADSRPILLARLREINEKGWIEAKRLQKNGLTAICKGQNCGGYTIEAELEILPNSLSEPDFMGWEIKQHGVGNFKNLSSRLLKDGKAITLMTPEPSGGYYREKGVVSFIRKYGYQDKRGRADRMNFGGVHKAGLKNPGTGLTLTIVGYDQVQGKILDASGGIVLISSEDEEPAASWSFADLMAHWNRKHALAAYVPSKRETSPALRYAYGPVVRLGEGTDFLRFLKTMADGLVYYDPGIKVENLSTAPKDKRRSQFRVKSRDLPALYESLTVESLT